jgi:hypothetical protein
VEVRVPEGKVVLVEEVAEAEAVAVVMEEVVDQGTDES